MEDMRKAGLNPILAHAVGGASTPSGAGFVPENILGQTVSSAMQVRRAKAEVDNIRAENANIKAQTAKISADAMLARALTKAAYTETGLKGADVRSDFRGESKADNRWIGPAIGYLMRSVIK